MQPGVPYGYVGPVCAYSGHHPVYKTLPPDAGSHDQPGFRPVRYVTEEDVRRIIREELDRSPKTTANTDPGVTK